MGPVIFPINKWGEIPTPLSQSLSTELAPMDRSYTVSVLTSGLEDYRLERKERVECDEEVLKSGVSKGSESPLCQTSVHFRSLISLSLSFPHPISYFGS